MSASNSGIFSQTPDYVIVVRHGARLDAADKTWHLSAARPFDPPLTYGGWTQSRALGLRIAAVVDALSRRRHRDRRQDREHARHGSPDSSAAVSVGSDSADDEEPVALPTRQVIIHSSPYLRCVQTAIAISAGIASSAATAATTAAKPRLRIDDFLGEWQSPGYFEDIAPPPRSSILVTDAKRGLMARGDDISSVVTPEPSGHSPGCWYSDCLPRAPPGPGVRPGAKGSNLAHETEPVKSERFPPPRCRDHGVYVAPVPSYALSASEPIPPGYVSHARDATVDVDLQWDSAATPQMWGDGGQLGEEWTAMHRRFRHGLCGMAEWYVDHGIVSPAGRFSRQHSAANSEATIAPTNDSVTADPDSDRPGELVVVMVTHGAGCNALLGALTNQPVLLDVSMSSVSVAEKRTDLAGPARRAKKAKPPSGRSNADNRLGSDDDDDDNVWLADEYEMRLVASTDHLRNGCDPAYLPPALLGTLGLAPARAGTGAGHWHSSSEPHFQRRLGPGSRTGSGSGSTSGDFLPVAHSYSYLGGRPSMSSLRESLRATGLGIPETKLERSQSMTARSRASAGLHRSGSVQTGPGRGPVGVAGASRPRVVTTGPTISAAGPAGRLWTPGGASGPSESVGVGFGQGPGLGGGITGVSIGPTINESWEKPVGQVGLWSSDRFGRFGSDNPQAPSKPAGQDGPVMSPCQTAPTQAALSPNSLTPSSATPMRGHAYRSSSDQSAAGPTLGLRMRPISIDRQALESITAGGYGRMAVGSPASIGSGRPSVGSGPDERRDRSRAGSRTSPPSGSLEESPPPPLVLQHPHSRAG